MFIKLLLTSWLNHQVGYLLLPNIVVKESNQNKSYQANKITCDLVNYVLY